MAVVKVTKGANCFWREYQSLDSLPLASLREVISPTPHFDMRETVRCLIILKMELKFFKTPADFRRWLERHHDTARELWVGYYKKSSGKPTITWPQSVDQALCFGWIDGIRKSIDDVSYMSRFTPRRPRSNWSAVNIRRVEALTALGWMQPAGLQAFAAREPSPPDGSEGRPKKLDEACERTLRAHARAWAFFQAQTPSYQRLASFWVMNAKQESTRQKRLALLIECSAQDRSIPQLARPQAKK